MFHELRSYIMRWDGVTELSIKLRRQDGGILSVIKTWVKLRKSAKIVCQGLFADCLLRDHHWLPVTQRIEYKLCVTVHRCLHGEAPRYLADLITLSAAATARAGLRSATSGSVAVPRTTSSMVTTRSLWPLRARGTSCRRHFVELIQLTFSNAN